MLLVNTKIHASPIQGIGLFAAEPIKAGTPIWKFVPGFDINVQPDDLEQIPEIARETFRRYCYLNTKTGLYILCFDDARFLNHADDPNIKSTYPPTSNSEGVDVATRDIRKGEELTCDYKEFDGEWKQKLHML